MIVVSHARLRERNQNTKTWVKGTLRAYFGCRRRRYMHPKRSIITIRISTYSAKQYAVYSNVHYTKWREIIVLQLAAIHCIPNREISYFRGISLLLPQFPIWIDQLLPTSGNFSIPFGLHVSSLPISGNPPFPTRPPCFCICHPLLAIGYCKYHLRPEKLDQSTKSPMCGTDLLCHPADADSLYIAPQFISQDSFPASRSCIRHINREFFVH